jgi:hypothetical protein
MGKLVECAGCGAEISRSAPACPKCGHPGPVRSRRYGCGTLLLLSVLAVLAFAVLGPHRPRPATPQAPAPPTASPPPAGVPAPGPSPAASFLADHPEFGHAAGLRALPDWDRGPRWGLSGPDGREFLLYGKDGRIVTVWEVDPVEGRRVVWGEAGRD